MRRASTTALLLALLGASACNPARGVPILLWHAVGEGSPKDYYDVPVEEFERSLQAVESFGAKTVSLDQVLDAAGGGSPLPERAVVLTFDDARACLKTSAMPVLQRHGMTAEVFVVTSWIADDEAHRRVDEDESGRHPYLTWPELREMVASGTFRVQSHSATHRKARDLSAEDLRRELAESRSALTAQLGVPVNFFAFPFGAATLETSAAVERAGYRAALVVEKGLDGRYSIKRRSFRRGGEAGVADALRQAFGAPAR